MCWTRYYYCVDTFHGSILFAKVYRLSCSSKPKSKDVTLVLTNDAFCVESCLLCDNNTTQILRLLHARSYLNCYGLASYYENAVAEKRRMYTSCHICLFMDFTHFLSELWSPKGRQEFYNNSTQAMSF